MIWKNYRRLFVFIVYKVLFIYDIFSFKERSVFWEKKDKGLGKVSSLGNVFLIFFCKEEN